MQSIFFNRTETFKHFHRNIGNLENLHFRKVKDENNAEIKVYGKNFLC